MGFIPRSYTGPGGSGPPGNLVAPSVSGTPQVDSVLTANLGSWTGSPTLVVAWWQDFGFGQTQVAGNVSTYTVQNSDLGAYLFIIVTAMNASGTGTAASPEVGPVTSTSSPVNTSVPVVSDTTPVLGETLTTTPGAWSGSPAPSFVYQWKNSGDGGATWVNATGTGSGTSTYTTNGNDVGKPLRSYVTADNGVGSPATANSVSTSLVASPPAPPSPVTPPIIT